jgi:glycerol kinase
VRTLYALEGTINGGAAGADRFGPGPTPFPDADPAPDAFCLPDQAGIGAPHWRAEEGFRLSSAAKGLSGMAARRVVLEGVIFRVREILEDLERMNPVRRIALSGGLARDPFVAPALAAGLDRPVERLPDTEATLLGAARLAAGRPGTTGVTGTLVAPSPRAAYLRRKFHTWQAWLRAELQLH